MARGEITRAPIHHFYCPWCEFRAHSEFDWEGEVALQDHILLVHGQKALDSITIKGKASWKMIYGINGD